MRWRRGLDCDKEHGVVRLFLCCHSHMLMIELGGDEDVVNDPAGLMGAVDTRWKRYFLEIKGGGQDLSSCIPVIRVVEVTHDDEVRDIGWVMFMDSSGESQEVSRGVIVAVYIDDEVGSKGGSQEGEGLLMVFQGLEE